MGGSVWLFGKKKSYKKNSNFTKIYKTTIITLS